MSENPSITVNSIYRYPVKGLSPEALGHVALRTGKTLPADRRYAIENGPAGFDSANPRYFPKTHFLMLARNERLAALQTQFDDARNVLTIRHNNADVAHGDLETEEGRSAIETFFAKHFANELKGPPKILTAHDHSFSDVAAKVVSIINLASLSAIEDAIGQPVHPLRFRGNFYINGLPPWREFDLVGKEIAIGDAQVRVVKTIKRCAAINVDPATAERDMNIPHTLMQTFGHSDCGVYAEVVADGTSAVGDGIVIS